MFFRLGTDLINRRLGTKLERLHVQRHQAEPQG
jgi:hypothetical protein